MINNIILCIFHHINGKVDAIGLMAEENSMFEKVESLETSLYL